MLRCKGATELFSKQMETKLTLTEKINLKVHKMICSGCSDFEEHIDTLRSLSKVYEPMDADSKPDKE